MKRVRRSIAQRPIRGITREQTWHSATGTWSCARSRILDTWCGLMEAWRRLMLAHTIAISLGPAKTKTHRRSINRARQRANAREDQPRQIAAIEGPQPRNRDPNREPMRLGTPRLGTHEADPILAEQLGGSPKPGE